MKCINCKFFIKDSVEDFEFEREGGRYYKFISDTNCTNKELHRIVEYGSSYGDYDFLQILEPEKFGCILFENKENL
jgi:hypothetical protein